MSSPVDPLLIEAWLRARSVARGLPQPVADRGGLRVETGLPQEMRRYVFAFATERLRDVADGICEPRIFLKLCDTAEALRANIPSRWQVAPPNFMMICNGASRRRADARQLPPGYRLELKTGPAVTRACILAESGEVAASGFAAEYAGVFMYDRILTAEAHRRKGLGAAIMVALASARRSSAALQILAATAAGRELYRTLGWTDYAPYTTAVIPDDAGASG
jgi:GNAT superfamily N-acetyltransferase